MRVPKMLVHALPTVLHSVLLLAPVLVSAGCGGPATDSATPPPPSSPTTAPAPAGAADLDDQPISEADVARPKDYPEALSRIEGYRDTIRDEIAAGRPTKAHRALDELDIVLNWLPSVARDGGVAKDKWEVINTTAQKIRELFNEVHSRIDAKQEPDYASVSAAIDQAIGALRAVTSASKSDEPTVNP